MQDFQLTASIARRDGRLNSSFSIHIIMEGIAANPIIHTIEGMKETQASRSLKMKQTPASRSWKKSAATPAFKSWGEGSYSSNWKECSCHNIRTMHGISAANPASRSWKEGSKPSIQIMEEVQLPHNPHHGRSVATPASRSWKAHQTPAFKSRKECSYPNITS